MSKFTVADTGEREMGRKYLSLAELTRRFGVTRQTVYKWMEMPSVALPDPVKIGNRNFFDIVQIEEWEARNTRRNKKVA